MNCVFIIFLSLLTFNTFCQDTIFLLEQKPIIGKIVFADNNIILYNKNNFIKDISTEFVFGYKQNNKLSIT